VISARGGADQAWTAARDAEDVSFFAADAVLEQTTFTLTDLPAGAPMIETVLIVRVSASPREDKS